MCEYAKLRAIHSIFRTLHSIHVQNLQDRNLYVFFFDECDYFVEQTSLNLSEEGRGLRSVHAFPLQVEEKVLVALESCTTSKTILLHALCFHLSSLGQRSVLSFYWWTLKLRMKSKATLRILSMSSQQCQGSHLSMRLRRNPFYSLLVLLPVSVRQSFAVFPRI
jgi:hypothetical protein